MASAIIGGKRRVLRAELQKKGKSDEKAAIEASGMKKPVAKKAKKKSAY